jgi:protein O-mannosyl-transferase
MLMIASPMPMRTSPWWLLLLAVIAYGGSVFGDFLLDDFSIFSDPVLTSASGWWEVWRPAQTRPLTYFTFWANYMVAGRQAAAYHVVNLTLHLGAVWLAFAVLRRLMPAQTAWFAAGIFAVHPMQSEAVNYIFARSTLLMAVFCLLSLNDWLGGRHWRAVLWFALALLAKEEAVGFAVFIALLHLSISRNQKERRPIAAMLGLSVLLGLRVLFATAITKGSGAGVQAGIGAWEYLARQGAVITGYLLGLAIPVYSIDPPSPPTSLWFLWATVLLLASIASRRFSGARAGFWILGGMALLLPSSSIFPAADVVAFRRMYLPLLAFAVALAMFLPKQTWILALLAGVSIYRCYVWANPERVWREAVHRNAYGLRPYIQLARTVEPEEAIRLLERAKTINPDSPVVFSELGRVYLTSGEPGKALGEFGRALAMAPENPQALSNRGVALLMLKQTAAAKSDFERALEIDPCAFEARLNALRMGLQPAPAPQCRYSEEERKALLEQ